MKKTMLIATFLAVGAGSAGVSAIDLKGSDTLKDFTLSVLDNAVCPGAAGIVYIGGGSGAGEAAMVAATPTQTVAPMSRFLGSTITTNPNAEGIAFAADGLSIAVSSAHVACDPNNGNASGCAQRTGGLRFSGTLNGGAYTLGATANVEGWRDVLRLVFLGLPGTAGKDPSPTAATPVRDCASPVRADLVNNYGNLFQDAACGTGGCTQLTHAFRRDLLSGTTDVFRELINAKLYPFCNTRFTADAGAPKPGVLSTGVALFDDAFQDNDPIRRTCAGGLAGQGGNLPAPTNNGTVQPPFPAAAAEQVCGMDGSLGLVLPIRAPVPAVAADISPTDAFPTKPCLRGTFNLGPAPKVPGSATRDTLCPNGDVPLGNVATDYNATTGQVVGSSGLCFVPAAADGDSQCINGRNNLPPLIDPPFPALVAKDGRVYNLHMYGPGGTPTYKTDNEIGKVAGVGLARQIVGAFTRIHSTRTLIATAPTCPGTSGDGRCCVKNDSTDQIGCLVEADPCSLGFAGGVALDQTLQTSAAAPVTNFGATINQIPNEQGNIVAACYPLARKVYFNSVVGFENVTGPQLELAKCFSGAVVGGTPAFNSLLAAKSLFPLPAGPVCQNLFPGASPTACSNNVAPIPH